MLQVCLEGIHLGWFGLGELYLHYFTMLIVDVPNLRFENFGHVSLVGCLDIFVASGHHLIIVCDEVGDKQGIDFLFGLYFDLVVA